MVDEIIKLLKKYNERFVDKEYYAELGKILMKNNNITQVEFNGIKFLTMEEAAKKFNANIESFEFTRAFYYEPEETIYLLLENIKFDTKIWNEYNLTEQEHYIFSNLLRSVFLFHEFEHVVQKRGKSGLEGILINDCPAVQEGTAYAVSPREHFANLYTYLIICTVVKKMNLPKSILEYFQHNIYITLYQQYLSNQFDKLRKNKTENEPVVEFYNKINTPISINLEHANNLEFLDRILFGFAITEYEYENFLVLANMDIISPSIILEKLDAYSKMDKSIFKNKDKIIKN